MNINIATYTAEKGLSWFYDKSVMGFEELDQCRRLLGPLPDFDAGDSGYEGVAAVGGKAFVIRCICAPKWDFMGRNATFVRVAWFERRQVLNVDIGKILASEAFCELSHEYKYIINVECDLSHDDVTAWATYSQMISNESQDVFIRRDIGLKDMAIKVVKKGATEMTEAEKFFSGKDTDPQAVKSSASVSMSRDITHNTSSSSEIKVEYSIGARVLAIVLFIVLGMLGVYLAKLAGKEFFGYVVMAGAFGVLRTLWNVRRS